jgi:hypothetical protein
LRFSNSLALAYFMHIITSLLHHQMDPEDRRRHGLRSPTAAGVLVCTVGCALTLGLLTPESQDHGLT